MLFCLLLASQGYECTDLNKTFFCCSIHTYVRRLWTTWSFHTSFGDNIPTIQFLIWSCFGCNFIRSSPRNRRTDFDEAFLFVLCMRGKVLS